MCRDGLIIVNLDWPEICNIELRLLNFTGIINLKFIEDTKMSKME